MLQCCFAGEAPTQVLLTNVLEGLEASFKSLSGYLLKKRQTFPRLYFLSDPMLLALLCENRNLESVRPHLR